MYQNNKRIENGEKKKITKEQKSTLLLVLKTFLYYSNTLLE